MTVLGVYVCNVLASPAEHQCDRIWQSLGVGYYDSLKLQTKHKAEGFVEMASDEERRGDGGNKGEETCL